MGSAQGNLSFRENNYHPSCLERDYFLYRHSSFKSLNFTKDIQKKRGKVKILVVDDEPMIRDLLKEMLESIGYEVHAVSSGQAALDYYSAYGDQVDIVLLDVMMPGMSGVDAFRRLKEMDPGIKAILASGYVESSQLDQAVRDGIKGFIPKPFALSELNRKIESIMDCQTAQSSKLKAQG